MYTPGVGNSVGTLLTNDKMYLFELKVLLP